MRPTKIVAVRKNSDGRIEKVLTSDGHVLKLEEAAQLARQGGIDSLTDIHEDGRWEIRHAAGTYEPTEGQNLGILPEF